MNGHSIKVADQQRLRLVSAEREPSTEPTPLPVGHGTPPASEQTANPWFRSRTQGRRSPDDGASRSADSSLTDAHLEYLAERLLGRGYAALNELEDALADRDLPLVIACCRKLSSIGELARLKGQALERRPA